MKTKTAVSLTLTLFFSLFGVFSLQVNAQIYKEMMHDPSVNFYDVVEEAEAYFKEHGKGKGSGWKGYNRWKYQNESRFYPDGDRSTVDPYLPLKSYQRLLLEMPQSAASPRRNAGANGQGKSLFSNGWNDLGPYSIDSITGHYAVGLGRIEDFYVNPGNDQLIYLGSRSGGFWKTTDGGTTWEGGTTDFLPASGVNCLDANPNNPNEILINCRNANNGASYGIYRSTDAGDTWALTNFNPTNLNWGGLGTNDKVLKIDYHPTIANLVFVGTTKGLYRSTE